MAQYTITVPLKDSSKARLDHIIILLPHKDLLNLPAWLTSNFNITPGGRHADGKTENKLILFFDGSYIELIAFIDDDPNHKAGHWWGEKKPGIIDYALTTDGDAKAHWEGVQTRLRNLDAGLGERHAYAQPVAGGRRRDDGVNVKWEVTFPQGVERGELPFFCHDVTARENRVPLSEEACSHPCRAYGVKQFVVTVPEAKAAELAVVHAALLGQKALADGGGESYFAVETVRSVKDAPLPRLSVQGPGDADRKKKGEKHGVVLGDLVLYRSPASEDIDLPKRLDTEDDYGRIVLDLHLVSS